MDEKKIALIIYGESENISGDAIKSAERLSVPDGYSVEIIPVAGENKSEILNAAMKKSDAKFKIYIDEKISCKQNNLLADVIRIFKSDEKIGVIGTSGAIRLSTHGDCFTSAKRCGKILSGKKKDLTDWGNVEKNFCEVEAADGFFLATQHDISRREDICRKSSFGDTSLCLEFRRAGYKIVVVRQKKAWLELREKNFAIDETEQAEFLSEYSGEIFPLVSVIIPTFNRPEWFKIALDSVLNQTYKNFEIVVVDNGTDDKTEILMKDYLEKYSCIKYFRKPGFNANENWNFARHYNNPDAEFVNWLMDDDYFYPKKFEKMVEAMRNNPDVSMVSSKRHVIDENGKIRNTFPDTSVHPEWDEILFKTGKVKGELTGRAIFATGKNFIGEPTTVLIRKNCLRDNDLCRCDDEEGFFPLIDISTWLQLLSKGNLYWIAEPLSAFRYHKKQASNWGESNVIFAICWAKIYQTEWREKFFIKSSDELRQIIANWIGHSAGKLRESYELHLVGEGITTLEKTLEAMARALHNGYKIELPPRIYEKRDDIKNF